MYPSVHAREAPDRAAVVLAGTGETVTYRQLDDRSARLARLLRDRGLEPGRRIAILLPNHARYLEVAWAAQRAGLYYTPVNVHVAPAEAAYVINDCGAAAVVAGSALAPLLETLTPQAVPKVHTRLCIGPGDAPDGWEPYDAALGAQSAGPVVDECEGDCLLYSAGTTGLPKGVKRPLTLAPMGHGPDGAGLFLDRIGLAAGDVFLCPAPLSHGAPLTWSMSAQRRGATVVVMERFRAAEALRALAGYGVTHSQWVPTMFRHLLDLPAAERAGYDLSRHRAAVHGAAPCPVAVKRRMIDWWGPIVHEYYSASEGVGATFITAGEWLERPGSVGRTMIGTAHILDGNGHELTPGGTGTVWFSGGYGFRYHNDPHRTAGAHNSRGMATVHDIGRLDADGYLYLLDRANRMIISGGVNIAPQEVENALLEHPAVADAAVLGVPHETLGEQVTAVVAARPGQQPGERLAGDLIAFCRDRLARYKCPRRIDFADEVPRLETGKLDVRRLRERYRSPS